MDICREGKWVGMFVLASGYPKINFDGVGEVIGTSVANAPWTHFGPMLHVQPLLEGAEQVRVMPSEVVLLFPDLFGNCRIKQVVAPANEPASADNIGIVMGAEVDGNNQVVSVNVLNCKTGRMQEGVLPLRFITLATEHDRNRMVQHR